MSNIHENLQKILHAVWGKDVRQAIHDAIHDCYEDGSAGSTDLIAREEIEELEATKATRIELAEETADRLAEVAVERGRIDNLVTSGTGVTNATKRTETTLFSASVPCFGNVSGTSGYFNLEDAIENYDYIKIRYSAFGKTGIVECKPSDFPTTGTIGSSVFHWSEIQPNTETTIDNPRTVFRHMDFYAYNISSGNTHRLSIDAVVFGWNGDATSNGKISDSFAISWDSSKSLYVASGFAGGIYSIIGVKYTDAGVDKDTELTDIRTGADGTVYQTAGGAVRGQIEDITNRLNGVESNFGDEYDSTATYAVGDRCVHEGVWYECNTAISTAEDWTEAHWDKVSLGDITDQVAQNTADIAENASDIQELKEDLNAVGASPESAITYSLTSGKVITDDGTIVTAQTSFAITNKIDVTNLNSVIITTEIGYGNMLYAFYSDTDAFISGEQSAQSGYTTITDKRVDVPENADYLYVCARSSSYAVTIIGIGRFALNIEPRVEALENSLSVYPSEEVLEKIAFTEETGDYISNSGALVTQGSSYYTTGYVDVSEYSEIYITGSGNYTGVIYAFYDSNKTPVLLGTAIASGSAYTTIVDQKTLVPEDAKYVIVAGRFASLRPNVKYFLKYKQVGKWNGKKWVCIGDSLTEENAAASKHYFNYIADDSNVNVINMGVGGTGYKRGEGENKAFYQRIANVPTNADFVTIFGSGNDLNTTLNYDIGTYTDTGTDTLCGCINTTLDNFYDICPATPIGIIAPTPWLGWPTTTPNNRMEEYVHAMKQVCNYRGVPFLDLYHESNLRPENTANRELCFYAQSLDGNADGVHPNDLGHKIIAPKIYEFIKKLMLA